MIISLILILLSNLVVFILLNWSFGFKKNKIIILILLSNFIFVSFVTGKLLGARYTIPLAYATSITNQSIEKIDLWKRDSIQPFTMQEWNTIKDERAKNILSQLTNECNANDTVYCYLDLGKFYTILMWTHKTGNENKIFLVSCELN